jgi:hypothetical protein
MAHQLHYCGTSLIGYTNNLTITRIMKTSLANRQIDPSPREIRQRCRDIQATWSTSDRLNRAGVLLGNPIRFVAPESRLLAAVVSGHRRGRAA